MGRRPSAKGRAQLARQRNPDTPRETWSGLGQQPLWTKDAKQKSKSMEQLRIAPDKPPDICEAQAAVPSANRSYARATVQALLFLPNVGVK